MTRKSKKSPKEKPKKANETETPPKKDPVQYVSETGDGKGNHQITNTQLRLGNMK